MSPKAAIAVLDEFVGESDAPIHVRDLLKKIIIQKGWFSESDSIEVVERWTASFLVRLRSHIQKLSDSKSLMQFRFSAASDEHIEGSCFVIASMSDNKKSELIRRANAFPMLRHLPSLTPRDFEILCGCVLLEMGADEAFVSMAGGDQGVDFYGRIPLNRLISATTLPDSVEENLRVWVVGQAKRYVKSSVDTATLRELVGSVELSKSHIFTTKTDPLGGLRVRVCDPVFYMFITSTVLGSGSRILAEKSGIVAFDGGQLCQFLADHDFGSLEGLFDANEFGRRIRVAEGRLTFEGPESLTPS